MDIAIILMSTLSGLATVVIAIYAWLNYKLINKIHFFNINITEFYDNNRRGLEASNDDNHRELMDILRAIVRSNLLTNRDSVEELKSSIAIFGSEYFCRTQIFSSEIKNRML